MPQIPFLFFAFSNSTEEYLPNLKKERDGILQHFRPLKHQSNLTDFEYQDQTSSKDLFNIFNQISSKVNIFHFSGHAGSMKMGLDDDKYSVQRLCNLIADADNINLVFLNGCATHDMVDALLKAGVKAVIATSEKVLDNIACDFSLAFYQAFTVQGRSLNEAYKMAVATLSGDNLQTDVKVVSRSLGFVAPKGQNIISWGLYHRDDYPEILDWELIKKAATPPPVTPITDLSKQIRDLIAKNKIDKVFKLFTENEANLDSDVNHTIILQSGRWSNLRNSEMSGIINAQQANLTRNQIVYALLQIVEDLE